MNYRTLGRSGLRVSELCLGTMTFGEDWDWGASPETSRALFDAYRDAGGNFVDTANLYTDGSSERIVGELVREDRDEIVLATKYTDAMRGNAVNGAGNHRKNMIQSLEASLQRLGTDRIDLFWLHSWDFATPAEEIMRALDDLVRAGKILYVGVSDTPAWAVARCNTLAELRGWTPFVAQQLEYSLIERTPERELLPMGDAFDLTTLAWSPLAGGLLSGKYGLSDGAKGASGRLHKVDGHPHDERNLGIAQAVVDIAAELGASAPQVALAWLLTRGAIPIVGATRPHQLTDNLGCLGIELSAEQRGRLDRASEIDLGFPHEFLAATREITWGGAFARTDRAGLRGLQPELADEAGASR